MPFGSIVMPSISFRSVGRSGATTSTTFCSSASWAPRLDAWRTACSAQSPLRPCSSARSRAYAAASLTTLRRRSAGISPPPTAIGVDEPMFVPGAMAATSAARVMNAPAEAAREPGGRDVDDDRDVGGELLLDDLAHGRVEPAGGVELDDDGVVALALAPLDRVDHVVLP